MRQSVYDLFLGLIFQIVYLDKGRVVEIGTYNDLMSAGLDVAQLISKHTNLDHAEEEKKKENEKVAKQHKKEKEMEREMEKSDVWQLYHL